MGERMTPEREKQLRADAARVAMVNTEDLAEVFAELDATRVAMRNERAMAFEAAARVAETVAERALRHIDPKRPRISSYHVGHDIAQDLRALGATGPGEAVQRNEERGGGTGHCEETKRGSAEAPRKGES